MSCWRRTGSAPHWPSTMAADVHAKDGSMTRIRSLVLVLLCALASACATTGNRSTDASTPDTGTVVAADATPEPAVEAPAQDVVIEPAPAASDIAATTQPQAAGAGDAEDDLTAIYGQPGDASS